MPTMRGGPEGECLGTGQPDEWHQGRGESMAAVGEKPRMAQQQCATGGAHLAAVSMWKALWAIRLLLVVIIGVSRGHLLRSH